MEQNLSNIKIKIFSIIFLQKEQIICSSTFKKFSIFVANPSIEYYSMKIVLEYKNGFLIKYSKIIYFHETFIIQIIF